ncbi:MAG: CPBP family intramembrane metalloprotease [Acetobacter sp.]|nr:CPBP family intramembrane metalloprotease [Bacteroides sp.]MCM1341056.1 CPBP family intramembrane metalloprotease [Acetobacter sp.]MCM1432388.1 CPBP family intramembrane metalloprotease [Clostridiales bacterium]
MSQYYYNPFGNSSDVNAAWEARFQLEQRAKQEKREIRKISLTMGGAIIAYLIVQVLAVKLLDVLGLTELYSSSPVFQYAFTIIGISVCAVAVPFGIMALINRKKYISPVIPGKKIKPLYSLCWVAFGVLCCTAANILVSYIVVLTKLIFGYELTQGESASPDSILACLMQFVAFAIVPAICEEFAMRCCSLQLLKKYGKGFAIFAVSIVFGLLHGNVIQFIFAFTIGLILAYITIKTDNVLPAIFIHAINNSLSVMQSVIKLYGTDDMAENAIIVAYVVFAVCGVLSIIYLAFKKQFKREKKQADTVLSNGEKFTAFLFPWMIIPFLMLICITMTTIKKV